MTKRKWILLAVCVCLLALIVWTVWQNLTIDTTVYTLSATTLPPAFDGFRIVMISDLHNTEFGTNNQTLVRKISEAKPDIIVITGDLLDSYQPDVKVAESFMEQVSQIAPCYFVPGNHENRLPMDYGRLRYRMKDLGVTILEDNSVSIERSGQTICLAGLRDYSKLSATYVLDCFPSQDYTILLSHRPEHFEIYSEAGMDLILSGHTHGGQVRLPLIGALFAPAQGIFPTYDYGRFDENGSTMIISRGLGNSSFPFRFNCQPELVIIDLKTK